MRNVSKIVLGSAQFGMAYGIANTSSRVSNIEAHSILDKARELGIDAVDTAVAYGESEVVLGTYGIQNWHVISKLPAVPDNCKNVVAWMSEEVCASIKRLQVAQLYAVLLHKPEQLLQAQGRDIIDGLRIIKLRGYSRKIGVSVYSPDELAELFALYPFDIIQIPCSILDRRLIETGWDEKLHLHGVEIHARSVFLQGLLLSVEAQARFPNFRELWEFWHSWLQDNQMTAMEACLNYVMNQPKLDKVVLGFDSARQLRDLKNIRSDLSANMPYWPKFDSRLLNPSTWDKL